MRESIALPWTNIYKSEKIKFCLHLFDQKYLNEYKTKKIQ